MKKSGNLGHQTSRLFKWPAGFLVCPTKYSGKKTILTPWLCLAAALFALSPQTSLALNTNMFEKEAAKVESFTAKVRVVRDISDEVEIFFDSDLARGAYSLPRKTPGYAAALKDLVESSKPQGPAVTVTADGEGKSILTVQKTASPAKPALDPIKDFDKIFK